LLLQLAAALVTGNRAIVCAPGAAALLAVLPAEVVQQVGAVADAAAADVEVALALPTQVPALRRMLAERDGPRVRVAARTAEGGEYPLEALVVEQTLTVNTAAAGGNASLMTLGTGE
jgi:RHH-type proline utilization regulon transcriptional repressor/proline dehydrogenase/delta 1-pyrroline-5-carboxylate dehydrogenase